MWQQRPWQEFEPARLACVQSSPPGRPDKHVFGDLAGFGSEYFESSSGFTPLVESILSLPADRSEPRPLSELLGPTGVDEVASFCNRSVLPTEVCSQRLAAPDAPQSFLDPKFRGCRRSYIRLVRRLVRCGVLCYVTTMLCDVGIFTVAKTNGKQRLVVDARRANLCFDEPPSVSLPTSASFAKLEVDPGATLPCT